MSIRTRMKSRRIRRRREIQLARISNNDGDEIGGGKVRKFEKNLELKRVRRVGNGMQFFFFFPPPSSLGSHRRSSRFHIFLRTR